MIVVGGSGNRPTSLTGHVFLSSSQSKQQLQVILDLRDGSGPISPPHLPDRKQASGSGSGSGLGINSTRQGNRKRTPPTGPVICILLIAALISRFTGELRNELHSYQPHLPIVSDWLPQIIPVTAQSGSATFLHADFIPFIFLAFSSVNPSSTLYPTFF